MLRVFIIRSQAITQTYEALHRPLIRSGTGIADTLSYPDAISKLVHLRPLVPAILAVLDDVQPGELRRVGA